MNSKWRIIGGIAGVVIVLGVVVGIAYPSFFPAPKPKKTKIATEKKKPKHKKDKTICPLDGEAGDVQGVTRPLAVMVENLSTIRPQAGLGSACVVVEGLAEGGITRFMLVFGFHGADNIGPVRSARVHFAALASGWDAIYAHVGGSIYAMKAIRDWGIKDWDQMGLADAYTRVGWTKAPHNVFTSTARLREAASRYKDGGDIFDRGFKFKPAPPIEARPQGPKSVAIDFSTSEYRVEYQYDRQTNTYKRFNGGKPHTDANSKLQLAPTNIAVLRAPTNDIPGGSGVLDINMEGTGSLMVFRDGRVVEGTWEKPTHNSPLKLINSNGDGIRLSPGQTWIEIVRPTTAITIQ
ncbi:MAG: DUF3048 domain-containing protein [Actinomycetota bacterium]|nr:DUF3048 domain-containing protein [Actinomycetota bacterium]